MVSAAVVVHAKFVVAHQPDEEVHAPLVAERERPLLDAPPHLVHRGLQRGDGVVRFRQRRGPVDKVVVGQQVFCVSGVVRVSVMAYTRTHVRYIGWGGAAEVCCGLRE